MDVNKNLFLNKKIILGKVNTTKDEIKRFKITTDDILLTRTSETKKEIAYASCLLDEVPNCVYSGFLLKASPIKKELTYAPYITLLLHSPIYRNKLMKVSTETSRALINSDNLSRLNLLIPSITEQQKIFSLFSSLEIKITNIEAKINILKKYKEGIMIKCYELAKNQVISLSKLVKNNIILLGRGEIIPKQNGTFPVYSSSAANNGLFCFRNKYSFDEELITWSIDGGGKPFLRNKHKFSITNVCGYAKILDLNIFSYSWLYINFWNSWRKIKFDYTTKAHPSVIEKLYKIKSLDIESQMKIEKILTYINNKIDYLIKELNDVTLTKESLLRSLFF